MGEFDLLARIRARLPQQGSRLRLGSGDDAAIAVPGSATATSVDALVDGIHFRREWSSPAQIGAKAIAAALSDLAAMGAEPGEAYVVLGLPDDFGEDECLELLDGMAAVAGETGTALAGGDLTRAPALTLALTVVGHAGRPEDLVTRAGARPGDLLVVTGELGGAAAGLLLLEAGGGNGAALLARQLEPRPRLGAGRALARGGATAMIDLSDGLGGDARHVAAASGVGLRIDAAAIPVQKGVDAAVRTAGRDPLATAISGGEDYELLATLPRERLEAAREAVAAEEGVALTAIGEVVAGAGVEIRLPDGGRMEPTGFDQLS